MSSRGNLYTYAGSAAGVAPATVAGAQDHARGVRRLAAAALAPMVAVTAWMALDSNHLQWPAASALYWGYLTAAPVLVGLYWWTRRPVSRFGPALVTYGLVAWVVSWSSSDWPPAFALAGLAEPLFLALALHLLLVFPMGRFEPRASRWLLVAFGAAVLLSYPPLILFSPAITGGGPLALCAPNCPQNPFQIGSHPDLVMTTSRVAVWIVLAVAAGVMAVFAARLRSASRPQRRALMAVALTSIVWLAAFFAFHLSRQLQLDAEVVDALQWCAAFARPLPPLGFLIALLQAELFAAHALSALLQRLAGGPTPRQWRDAVAGALDDDALRLAFYEPVTQRFREPDGAELEPAESGGRRVWVPIDRDEQPVAAMVIDETLAEDPELVAAATTATLVAVENGALEGELAATRARIVEAGDAERRRIARDLHDTAQQRLVALRIHLMLTGEQLGSRDRAKLERLDLEVEQAIEELRAAARRTTPDVLLRDGIAAALRAAVAYSPMPVAIHADGLTRHCEALESAVYFCCIECLQNAAKHAGRDASVTIRISEFRGRVGFTVADDGSGFDPATVPRGAGLDNLAERVREIGGTVRIDSRPGAGTRVTAHFPPM